MFIQKTALMNTDEQLTNPALYLNPLLFLNTLTPNHSASDMPLIPIQKLYSARDSIRKAREAFLITKANTLEPNGLNKRDETY